MATMLRRTEYRVPEATPERVHEVLQSALAPMEARSGFLGRIAGKRTLDVDPSLDAILTALQIGKPADVPEKRWVGETQRAGDEGCFSGFSGFFGCYVRRDPGGVHLVLTYSIEAAATAAAEAADGRSVGVELKLEWERHGVAATRTPARDLYLHVGAWQGLLEDALRRAGFTPEKGSEH